MKVRPVKKYKNPKYPTRTEFLQQQSDLRKYVPSRWKNNKFITSALAVFLFGSSTSVNKQSSASFATNITIDPESKSHENIDKKIGDEKYPAIAPLFIHGGGRGSSGCVIINPASFLSEEEARIIIESELKKEGILFDKKDLRIDELSFTRNYGWENEDAAEDDDNEYADFEGSEILLSRLIPMDTLVLDAYSSKYNLAYEFVSFIDEGLFGGKQSMSTASSYDVIKSAGNLREKMIKYGKMNAVIFYDPIEGNEQDDPVNEELEKLNNEFIRIDNSKIDWVEFRKQRNKKSYELLRKQVADFIDWIKQEGLLKENK